MLKMYDFSCRACDHNFEKLVLNLTDTQDRHAFPDINNDVSCPLCHSTHTQRIMSANSFKVNGTGAYSNRMKV